MTTTQGNQAKRSLKPHQHAFRVYQWSCGNASTWRKGGTLRSHSHSACSMFCSLFVVVDVMLSNSSCCHLIAEQQSRIYWKFANDDCKSYRFLWETDKRSRWFTGWMGSEDSILLAPIFVLLSNVADKRFVFLYSWLGLLISNGATLSPFNKKQVGRKLILLIPEWNI